jgi:hypothetical protein
MRRWDTTVSQLKPDDVMTWARFSSALLSSQEGKHPAEHSRQSYTNMRFKATASTLNNMLHYNETYERMLEHCGNSHVTVPSSYDLATHYLAFANNASMQVSVAVQSVWVMLTSALQDDGALPNGQSVAGVYAHAFDKMRERGMTTAKVQDSREQDTAPSKPGDQPAGESYAPREPREDNPKRKRERGDGKGVTQGNNPTKAATGDKSVSGLKEHLKENGISLDLLAFGGAMNTCYYCGGGHKSHTCDTNFSGSNEDTVRQRARTLGQTYWNRK